MKKPIPKYDAFRAEMAECRRIGLAYVASDPVSFIVLDADDMRREGKIQEAQKLENAGMSIARSQAVALAACRRGHIRMKPRKIA
jgi:hypothetical protein